MKPHYQDNHNTIYCLDFRENDLQDGSVQMVVTSPPYWGLRKYSGEQDLIWGGDKDCEHEWATAPPRRSRKASDIKNLNSKEATVGGNLGLELPSTNICVRCGAWKGAYGLEPTPEMYAQHTIEILREIRRVLRKDGVVFWNIGDSYWGGKGQSSYAWSLAHPDRETFQKPYHHPSGHGETRPTDGKHSIIKPKDLCLIPFRIAIAAQTDGWWVRSVIIWSKPNPMPESVKDRPTESHEYILMLTKSAKYYWDLEAVREPLAEGSWERSLRSEINAHSVSRIRNKGTGKHGRCKEVGRNIRSVWEFATQPSPRGIVRNFAVFPEKLPELCIKAATPEVGCCAKCGAPWERITETSPMIIRKSNRRNEMGMNYATGTPSSGTMLKPSETKTLGWQPTCKCKADKVPSIVLDPFLGAGTTLLVAKNLNRRAVGYDLSMEYCDLALDRNRQQALELI